MLWDRPLLKHWLLSNNLLTLYMPSAWTFISDPTASGTIHETVDKHIYPFVATGAIIIEFKWSLDIPWVDTSCWDIAVSAFSRHFTEGWWERARRFRAGALLFSSHGTEPAAESPCRIRYTWISFHSISKSGQGSLRFLNDLYKCLRNLSIQYVPFCGHYWR